MLRTIVTADNRNLHLSIPKEYLGKKVEILWFSIDEPTMKSKVKKKSKVTDADIDSELLKLSENTLSSIWETKENKIWDEFYLKTQRQA